MRYYQKSFVNPLLAEAFADGVNYVNDPDFKALLPRKSGAEWIVVIEDTADDEEDESEPVVAPLNKEQSNGIHIYDLKNHMSFNEYLSKFESNTKNPETPEVFNKQTLKTIPHEIIIADEKEPIGPCGKCIDCLNNRDCLFQIYDACSRMDKSF